MASDSFRLHLPDRPVTDMSVAEYSFGRRADCSAIARRAKVLCSLVGFRTRDRNGFARAVGDLCKHVFAAAGGGVVEFGIREADETRCLEVRVVAEEANRSVLPNYFAAMNGDLTERLQKLRRNAVYFRLPQSNSANQRTDRSEIQIAWALPVGFRIPSEWELTQWRRLLDADSNEEAIALMHRQNKQLHLELGRVRGHQNTSHQGTEHLAMLSLVVSKATNAISIVDTDGIIEWVNNAFSEMTGYCESEAVGKKLDELLFGPNTSSKAVREFHQALCNGHELTQDVLQYKHDGCTFWAECNLIPVHDDDGRLKRWIAIESDITKRRRTEEALRAAKKSAESTSRAKSEFLANMSHEIRTPLNAILGMTELALTTKLSSEQQDYLRTVQASAQTLLQLLNDILDLSKIEAGKLTIEKIEFRLADVIRDTLKALAVKAHEKGLHLASHVPLDIPQLVTGDPTRLRQVLFNLVGNAIKFTESGEVIVQVEEQWRSEDEIGIHISVHDTGIGIPSDRLQAIFESFTQVDSSMARRFGGTGLGLTITAQLLSLMKGRIWVRSDEGKGSTFHFSLPLKLSQAPRLGGSSDVSLGDEVAWGHEQDVPFRSLQILVVDDHQANRSLASTILSRRGHQCTEAIDGQQALERLDQSTFDVVLMDVQMPHVDGFRATAEIRKREHDLGSHLPVVALTAHAMSGDREKCLAAGMDAYLAKPVDARELVAVVERLAGVSPVGQTQQVSPTVQTQRPEAASASVGDYDFGPALERMNGELDLLLDVMDYFLKDAPALIAKINDAVNAADGPALQAAAHRLKSLIAGYDHAEGAQFAQQLELLGRNSDFSEASLITGQLGTIVDELCAAIKHYRRRTAAA